MWFQKIPIPPPPPPTEDHWKFQEGGGFVGNYFPMGDRPCTKHWKQHTIDLKDKNMPTYVVLKQKSVLLAIDRRLTSLALMFLFFFKLASATISRRTMCLWNKVENDWKWRTKLESCLRLVFVRPTLKCFHFCSLSIPFRCLDMQDTFLIGFMFYQCLLRVETHEKCDETRVLSFPFLARPLQGPATWLVNSAIVTMFTKPSALALYALQMKFSALK